MAAVRSLHGKPMQTSIGTRGSPRAYRFKSLAPAAKVSERPSSDIPESERGRIPAITATTFQEDNKADGIFTISTDQASAKPATLASFGFSKSADASLNLAGALFYAYHALTVKELHKKCNGSTGGVGLAGGGISWGSLSYDDLNDLEGDCNVAIVSTAVYVHVSYFKGTKHVAWYNGGGIGTMTGSFGGKGWFEDTS